MSHLQIVKPKNERLVISGSLIIIVLVGLVNYIYTIGLPFYWDDLWHFLGHVSPYSLPQIFLKWRAVQFATYRVFRDLQGAFVPATLHLFSLALHLVSCALCYALLANLRLPNRYIFALGGALFYALFPFSAQAVSWVAALGHLWAGALILGALVLWQASRAPAKGSMWLRAGSLACAFIAPFANESGLVIFLLIALLLMVEGTPFGRGWYRLVPYIAVAFICLILLRLIRPLDTRISDWALSLNDIKLKAAYVLQALCYPFASLVTWLYRMGIKIPDYVFAFLAYTLIFTTYLGICWRWRILRYALLGAGCFLLATAPAIVMMPTDYVLSGPRLLYVGAFGAALVWALPLVKLPQLPWRSLTRSMVALTYIAVIAVSGVPYLNSVRGLALETQRIIAEFKTVLQNAPNPVLSVNFPSAIFLKQEVYLVGSYRPSILPESSPDDLTNLMALNGAPGHEIKHQRIEAYFPEQTYRYQVAYALPNNTPISLTKELRNFPVTYRVSVGNTVSMLEAGGFAGNSQSTVSDYLARFSDSLVLESSIVTQNDTQLVLHLQWRCLQPIAQATQVFVHVYDQRSNLVVGQDIQPLLGMSDVRTWQPGDIWRDVRYINFPADLPPGSYRIVLGTYTLPDVVRLPAYDSNNQRLDSDALLVATIQSQ